MSALRKRDNASIRCGVALLIAFALISMSVGGAAAQDGDPCQSQVGRVEMLREMRRVAGFPVFGVEMAIAEQALNNCRAAQTVRAGVPDGQPQQDLSAADKDSWPIVQEVHTDGVVSVDIVNRPEGDNVVTITPNGDGITITGADDDGTQSEAPLWPDHPQKGDPEADPGSQRVGEAIGGQRTVVVLNRPATTTSDGEEHESQWDAWHTTYLELISNGEPFIECETDHIVPEAESCWVVDPTLVPDPQQAEDADDQGDGQGAKPPEAPLSPEERWPGRNFEWTDPGQVGDPSSDGGTTTLTTTGQNPEDGSEITIVNVPSQTDDAEQRKRNFDLENETLDALEAAGEPYVICFDAWTSIDIRTGDTVTIPAYCNVR